jgi:hypothetical protein
MDAEEVESEELIDKSQFPSNSAIHPIHQFFQFIES